MTSPSIATQAETELLHYIVRQDLPGSLKDRAHWYVDNVLRQPREAAYVASLSEAAAIAAAIQSEKFTSLMRKYKEIYEETVGEIPVPEWPWDFSNESAWEKSGILEVYLEMTQIIGNS